MSKHRFRYSKDFDVPAASKEEALQVLAEICSEIGDATLQRAIETGSFEYLGDADVRDVETKDQDIARRIHNDRVKVVSMQYRGENFAVVCASRDVGATKEALKPLALILREHQLEHLTDLAGQTGAIVTEG